MKCPKIIDNDCGEITAVFLGREVRSWLYSDEQARRMKMRAAGEFLEGWYQCEKMHEEADNIASEAAWEAHQERLMESGGTDDSHYRKQMKDAGIRGFPPALSQLAQCGSDVVLRPTRSPASLTIYPLLVVVLRASLDAGWTSVGSVPNRPAVRDQRTAAVWAFRLRKWPHHSAPLD